MYIRWHANIQHRDNPCPGDLVVLPFSFYCFGSVLSFDIFLEHVVSRYQIPKQQKMMALSPNNEALVSPVFTYFTEVLDLLSG